MAHKRHSANESMALHATNRQRGQSMIIRQALTAVIGLCWCTLLSAAPLRLYTEDYRPLSFIDNGVLSGMAVEVAETLLRDTQQAAVIELVPWTRAYQQALREANVGIFPTVRTPRREARFHWVGPIAAGHTSFYSRKTDGLQVRNLEDVARLGTLAVPKQWYSHELLSEMGLNTLYAVPTPEHMMRMFKHRRVALLLANSLTLDALLATQDMRREQLQLHYTLMDHKTYIAFSLGTDPALVRRWQQALDNLRRNGELARIHRRWFPQAGEAELSEIIDLPPGGCAAAC